MKDMKNRTAAETRIMKDLDRRAKKIKRDSAKAKVKPDYAKLGSSSSRKAAAKAVMKNAARAGLRAAAPVLVSGAVGGTAGAAAGAALAGASKATSRVAREAAHSKVHSKPGRGGQMTRKKRY